MSEEKDKRIAKIELEVFGNNYRAAPEGELSIVKSACQRIAELEAENASLKETLAAVVSRVQRYQRAGSQPPGGPLVTTAFILHDLAGERDLLRAQLAEERALLDWLDEHWGRDRFFVHRSDGVVLIYDGPLSSVYTKLVARGRGLRATIATARRK